MRSERENKEWFNHITRTYDNQDHPEELMPAIPWELARHVWETENSSFSDFRESMLSNIATMDSLKSYLGFQAMDDGLWCTLSPMLYRLLERDDISNVDKVVALIKEFVVMCPHFYSLRFGRRVLKRSKESSDESAIAATTETNAANVGVELAAS